MLKRILNFCSVVLALSLANFAFNSAALAQGPTAVLPDAPSFVLQAKTVDPASVAGNSVADISSSDNSSFMEVNNSQQETTDKPKQQCPTDPKIEVDKDCNPIPLERQQPHRILGFMPNFRSVSAGAKPHPPGWKYNFEISTRQSFDYSSFIFLGLTTITAEATNSHPVLGKGADGFYAYLWRGFLDKTDGSYMQGFFMPSLLHEDTRYYPLGPGHRIIVRALYVISRQGVARTYGGRQTPNIAGLGAKILTQIISRTYYPTGATSFSVLATKFGYAAMRDVGFQAIREFYPDTAAHYIKRYRAKAAKQAARDAAAAGVKDQSTPQPDPGNSPH